MSLYLRMNVGLYQGEIRGPFRMDAAKALIERGDASPTESIGDGKFRVIEAEPAPESIAVEEKTPVAIAENQQPQISAKKVRR